MLFRLAGHSIKITVASIKVYIVRKIVNLEPRRSKEMIFPKDFDF